ncbi:MAG: hypothetical protein GY839_21730 [candidate division Zixibacteria bacterium]|nr:hypothetical protein [candidate division Zixibacteria bacterium]
MMHPRYQKTVAVLLSIFMLTIPLMTNTAMADGTCEEGMIDGKADGHSAGSPLWILAGFGCGCLGAGAAYLVKPSPPAERLIGMSPEYVVCYTDSYKKEARNRQVTYAIIGWGLGVVVVLATYNPDD